MPWIRTPAGTLVPDDFMAEVQLLFNIAGAIEDCDLSDDARGLMEAEMLRLECELDKEYINEYDDSWDDRTEVGVFGDDEHEEMVTGQEQNKDGAGELTQEEDKTREAGELTQDVEVEVERVEVERVVELRVEVGADEQTYKEFGVDVGAGERTQDGGVRAAESTQVRAAEADVAAGVTSCSGSVVDWVEDWIQDSVIIDIGADAAVWNSELGFDAVKKHIADAYSENGAGTEDSAEVGVGFVKEKLMQFDDATDERYWTGQSVGLESECGIDGFAAWLDSLAGGGTEDSAEVGSEDWIRDSVVDSIGGWDCDFDADAVGEMIAIEMDAAGLDSLVTGSGSVVIPDVSFGFGSGFEEKMIQFTDVAETARGDEIEKEGSDDIISGFGRDVVSEFVCAFDVSGRFGSNILYDPGGSAVGLSSWGLLVSSVFASVEAHSVVVIVLLRALWSCCEIMSFGALEALKA